MPIQGVNNDKNESSSTFPSSISINDVVNVSITQSENEDTLKKFERDTIFDLSKEIFKNNTNFYDTNGTLSIMENIKKSIKSARDFYDFSYSQGLCPKDGKYKNND